MSAERTDDLGNGRVVIQNPAFFCFGIDAVLLAHFPVLRRKDTVMDLCTGNGVIPLIMSAEAEKNGFDGVHFSALEIQPPLAEMASRSVSLNGLSDRISVREGDIRKIREIEKPMSYTLVTCNPPYLPAGSGAENETEALRIARHETHATLRDAVKAASYLLKNTGRFALVHRPERLAEIFETLRESHLEPKRLRMVHPYAGKAANLVLLEAVKCGRPALTAEPPLIVYESPGRYTKEIYEIYGMAGK